jgi:L-lactate dehydrogenase (cytochrome)
MIDQLAIGRPVSSPKSKVESTVESEPKVESHAHETPLSVCTRIVDFEEIAKSKISSEAYIYISSAADTLQSHQDNISQWSKITFIPRVLKDVTKSNLATSMMNQPCSLPIFIAATG